MNKYSEAYELCEKAIDPFSLVRTATTVAVIKALKNGRKLTKDDVKEFSKKLGHLTNDLLISERSISMLQKKLGIIEGEYGFRKDARKFADGDVVRKNKDRIEVGTFGSYVTVGTTLSEDEREPLSCFNETLKTKIRRPSGCKYHSS